MTEARASSPAPAAPAPGPLPARVAPAPGPLPARVALGAYALGLGLPVLAAGAVSALALAVSQPPLVALTGVGRWAAYPVFQANALGLSMWLAAGPAAALALVAARAALPAALAAPAAGLAATLALALQTGWSLTGGAPLALFLGEARDWALRFLPFALGGAIWLQLVLHLARRRHLRRSRR